MRARRHERLARRAAHARRDRSTCGSPSPASTTSTTPWRPPRPRSSWASPLATVGEALEGFGGAFGRVETIPIGGREVSILLVKNPAGANEVLRTLTLEDGALDLWLALNDRIADGRDVSWIWDADFEVLAGPRAARDLLRHARRGDGAAAQVRGRSTRSSWCDRDLGALARRRGRGRRRRAALYALPTYTALLELRDLLSRRGLGRRWSE